MESLYINLITGFCFAMVMSVELSKEIHKISDILISKIKKKVYYIICWSLMPGYYIILYYIIYESKLKEYFNNDGLQTFTISTFLKLLGGLLFVFIIKEVILYFFRNSKSYWYMHYDNTCILFENEISEEVFFEENEKIYLIERIEFIKNEFHKKNFISKQKLRQDVINLKSTHLNYSKLSLQLLKRINLLKENKHIDNNQNNNEIVILKQNMKEIILKKDYLIVFFFNVLFLILVHLKL